jgi:hypothetical protein
MGELKRVFEDLLDKLRKHDKSIRIEENGTREYIRIGAHTIVYSPNGFTTTLTYVEKNEAPITIDAVEQPGKCTFTYCFHPARYEEVKKLLENAGVLGGFLKSKIAGYDPKQESGRFKRLTTPLPQREPFKEIADLIEQHIF